MQHKITIKFKDGKQITVENPEYDFVLLNLGNEMYFNAFHGTLYKVKGNVICGEDITDTVDEIEISMKY